MFRQILLLSILLLSLMSEAFPCIGNLFMHIFHAPIVQTSILQCLFSGSWSEPVFALPMHIFLRRAPSHRLCGAAACVATLA